MKIGKFTLKVDEHEPTWRMQATPEASCRQCAMLMQQNRELHDRLLAVYAPTVAQTLPAMPSFQVDYHSQDMGGQIPKELQNPQELPGTQVGDGE
jgi:hypothetical protein